MEHTYVVGEKVRFTADGCGVFVPGDVVEIINISGGEDSPEATPSNQYLHFEDDGRECCGHGDIVEPYEAPEGLDFIINEPIKVGDKVTITTNSCFALGIGEIATVTKLGTGGYLYFRNDATGNTCSGHGKQIVLADRTNTNTPTILQETNPKEVNTMDTATKLRDLKLSDDDKLLRKYQVIDNTGKLTSTGETITIQFLYELNKAKIVAELTKLDATEVK